MDKTPQFRPTRWSMIARIKEGSSRDLEEFCSDYWYPLYAYSRRLGNRRPDSEDLTQGFFSKLLEKEWIKDTDESIGRFRTFLLTYFKRFIQDEWSKAGAIKRGGRAPHVPIDFQEAERRYVNEPVDCASPDVLFDQAWASTLLGWVLTQLQGEFFAAGRRQHFEVLQGCLAWNSGAASYASLAGDLGISVAGVKSAVHRMRGRYRVLLRRKIEETVQDRSEVDDEISALFAVFD